MSALAGQRAIVTGGASGIGAAIISRMIAAGARPVALDVKEPTDSEVAFVLCDVSETTSVNAAVEEAVEQLGGLDTLVNCAGVGAQGGILTSSDEDWHRVLNVNVVGIARVTRAAWPHLASSAGNVVNISSVAASVGLVERVAYSASKGAVAALTRALAADGIAEDVRVNAVSPGTVDTPWVGRLLETSNDPATLRRALESRQPTGRLVSPEQVAEAVVFLANPANRSCTGLTLEVDGGMTSLVVK